MSESLYGHLVKGAIHVVRAALILLPEENLEAHQRLLDQARLIKVQRVQVELNLVQVLQVWPYLLIDVVELLIGVAAGHATVFILQKLT